MTLQNDPFSVTRYCSGCTITTCTDTCTQWHLSSNKHGWAHGRSLLSLCLALQQDQQQGPYVTLRQGCDAVSVCRKRENCQRRRTCICHCVQPNNHERAGSPRPVHRRQLDPQRHVTRLRKRIKGNIHQGTGSWGNHPVSPPPNCLAFPQSILPQYLLPLALWRSFCPGSNAAMVYESTM